MKPRTAILQDMVLLFSGLVNVILKGNEVGLWSQSINFTCETTPAIQIFFGMLYQTFFDTNIVCSSDV